MLSRKRTAVFAAALILWLIGMVVPAETVPETVPGTISGTILPLFAFMASWLLAGFPVIKAVIYNFYRSLRLFTGRTPHKTRKNLLDENFLMTIATIGAFAVGEWAEAAAVMIFYMVGELIQEAAIYKSRSSIKALLALKPDKARLEDGNGWKEVPAAEVAPGSLVLVRPGERIPLDGVILEGASSVDTSMLTGESRPVYCTTGSGVFSGTVSLDGLLKIKTTRSAGDSSAARIVQLVESAREAKAKPERFITAFARWYTPLVVGGAFLLAVLPPLLLPGALFSEWFYRALILLVISCPCALVVSVPLGYFAGIGGMSRRGIMVKGALHLDSLKRTKNVAFDKTGTLTKGKFSVVAIEPGPGVDKETLLETAVQAELESNHPIARAILEFAGTFNGGIEIKNVGMEKAERFEIAGQGVELVLGGVKILAGNRRLLASRQAGAAFPVPEETETYTPVCISRDGKYLGRILVGDTLKDGALEAVNRLRGMGIKTSMITGDTRLSAMEAASRLGIETVKAGLLPEEKLQEVEKLTLTGETVFVGDGINDAPVLARSNVGMAMGSGADVAVEAADVILITDDPGRVPEAIERARKTRRIVMGNIVLALGAKGFFIILAGLGMANMWIALIADVGVALAAILNSTRALR